MSAVGGTATRRRYRDNTLILETDFETESGAVTFLDFMPFHREGPSRLIRLVEGQLRRAHLRIRDNTSRLHCRLTKLGLFGKNAYK